MKKIFRVLLIIIVVIVVIAGILASYIALRGIPKYDVHKIDVKINTDSAHVANGLKLATMLCRHCHYNENTQKFTGREITEVPQFGTIYSANITQDTVAGIGKWSDADIVYLLRTGVKPDGQYIPPYMPKFVHVSDEDLFSVIAFLRSSNAWVQADNTRPQKSKPSFLTKFLITIGKAEPFDYPDHPIPGPDTSDLVKWGKYIATEQLECFSCHSRDFAKNDFLHPEKSEGFFGGGNEMYGRDGKKRVTLNITMDENTGIGKWTEEQFIMAVKSGEVPNGPALRDPMQPYTLLSDQEVKAIYAYLKTIPKLDHKVERKID